jgi:hypothetical protein
MSDTLEVLEIVVVERHACINRCGDDRVDHRM